jgi:hypothetical protein
MVDFIKNLPESDVTFLDEFYRQMEGAYTGIGARHIPEGRASIKEDLIRNHGRVLTDLQDEVTLVFNTEIGVCRDWTPVTLHLKMLQIVASLSGRTFVGLPLSRDVSWRDATTKFTVDAVAGAVAVKKHHPLVRRLVSPFLPELHRLAAYQKFAKKKLDPVITALSSSGENNKTDRPNSLLRWTLDRVNGARHVTTDKIGRFQMAVAFASIHTTGMTLTNVVLDLAAHPEYARELRAEAESVAVDGCDDGLHTWKFNQTGMSKLKKLDSFLKESQRVTPPGLSKYSLRTTFLASSQSTANIPFPPFPLQQ